MKLYDYVLSGNCYKIRLLLTFLGQEYQPQPVDFFPGKEHKTDAFLKINTLGQLPVLEDQGQVICDAQAILVYLAENYDDAGDWWPKDALTRGKIAQWLAFADGLTATSSAARLHDMLNYDLDVVAARNGAHRLFRVMEDHLSHQEFAGQDWLVGSKPSIADTACFPYTALAEDGGIDLFLYPSIQRWVHRFAQLPGFINMPGINMIP